MSGLRVNRHFKKELLRWLTRVEAFWFSAAAFSIFTGFFVGAAIGLMRVGPPELVVLGVLIGVVVGFFARNEVDKLQLVAIIAERMGENPTDAELGEADEAFGEAFRALTSIHDSSTGAERDPTAEELRASWEKMVKASRVLRTTDVLRERPPRKGGK